MGNRINFPFKDVEGARPKNLSLSSIILMTGVNVFQKIKNLINFFKEHVYETFELKFIEILIFLSLIY